MKGSITPQIFSDIQKRLKLIEIEHNIDILLAVESGSRAWGFESLDSDYDIRFIYVNKKEHYLSIDNKRDVIEYPIIDLIDINGWDLRKSLSLFQKSNPTFSEWIKSPIIYYKNTDFREKVLELEKQYFSPKGYLFHYISMAESNFREYLKTDFVKSKKYFYVLRPVLACLWIEKNLTPPSIEFDVLLNDCDDINGELKTKILYLLVRKKKGDELDKEPKIEILNNFLEDKIQHFKKVSNTYSSNSIDIEILNKLFIQYIK